MSRCVLETMETGAFRLRGRLPAGQAARSLMEIREIRVLLVEDNPAERRLIILELAETEEPFFRVQEASRLLEAETSLRNGSADVVLLDLSLPDSDGLKGLTRICQEFPSLPVVVFTGLDDQETALRALREGGQDFLVKGQTEPGMLKRVLLHAIERKRVDVALNTSRESLREAQRLETLGRLAGKIAHDFNNILTTIIGFSDLLLEDLQGHSCLEYVQEVKKAGERGAALTSSILSFSRHERPNLDSLSINEAILGVCGMLKQLLPKNIHLELDLQPDLPDGSADLGQMEQVLVNLVVNARDALPQGGTVRIRTELRTVGGEPPISGSLPRPGQYVAVLVEDDGSGMDSATLDRVFEPFFTTKPRGAGTGLGLSTVIGIVRGCGGGIEVRSKPDVGTAFILYFPLFAPSTGAVAASERVAVSRPEIASILEQPEAEADWRMSKVEMSEHLRHLYHVVSHDFHEPLRMVNSYLGLLKRRGGEKLADDLGEFIDLAVDGSKRMQSMLDGVLRYSRALKSLAATDPTPAKAVYEKVLRGLPGSQVVRWEGEQPTLETSAEHFAMILRELLSNALKFADPNTPEVTVECRREGDDWLFQVTDNGSGVPAHEVEKCFLLFGRLHGRDEYPGLGIGLAIAQCLSTKYQARLTIASAPGGGGRACLRWPIKKTVKEKVACP